MRKRAKELSARRVDTMREDGRHALGGVVGLYLSVRGYSRTWVLRIKVGGRRRELGLGSYPEVSLAVARDKAWEDEAEAAYQRGTLLMKRAALMEQWARFCCEVSPSLPGTVEFDERKVA